MTRSQADGAPVRDGPQIARRWVSGSSGHARGRQEIGAGRQLDDAGREPGVREDNPGNRALMDLVHQYTRFCGGIGSTSLVNGLVCTGRSPSCAA